MIETPERGIAPQFNALSGQALLWFIRQFNFC